MNFWDWFRIAWIALAVGVAAWMYPQWSRAGELYLELGAGYDRHQLDEAPQSVIRLRYELDKNPWWMPDVIEIDHHSSIEKTSGEKLVDQASVIWRFQLF